MKKAKKTQKKLNIPEVYEEPKNIEFRDYNYSGYGMSDNNFGDFEDRQGQLNQQPTIQLNFPQQNQEPQYGSYGKNIPSNQNQFLNQGQDDHFGFYGNQNTGSRPMPNQLSNEPQYGTYGKPASNVAPNSAPQPQEPQYGSYGKQISQKQVQSAPVQEPQYGNYSNEIMQNQIQPAPVQEPQYGSYGNPNQNTFAASAEQSQEPQYGTYGSNNMLHEVQRPNNLFDESQQNPNTELEDKIHIDQNTALENTEGFNDYIHDSLALMQKDGKIALPEFLNWLKLDINQLQLILGVITKDKNFSFKYIKPTNDFSVLYFCDENNHLVPLTVDRILEVRDVLFSIIRRDN